MISFGDLPKDLKDKFYYAGRKGDWTAEEAYEHLVPNHLKDNPNEIRAWMDGDPILGVPDRDISRIVSGSNGGKYNETNTIMEDMSLNRSRGSDNMTMEEYHQTIESNAEDAAIIENHFTGDVMYKDVDATEMVTPVVEESLLDATMGAMWEGVLPAAAAVTAGAYVGDRFQTKQDRLGYGALAAGGAALLAMTPPGQLAMLGFAGYKIVKAGQKVYNGLNTEKAVG